MDVAEIFNPGFRWPTHNAVVKYPSQLAYSFDLKNDITRWVEESPSTNIGNWSGEELERSLPLVG